MTRVIPFSDRDRIGHPLVRGLRDIENLSFREMFQLTVKKAFKERPKETKIIKLKDGRSLVEPQLLPLPTEGVFLPAIVLGDWIVDLAVLEKLIAFANEYNLHVINVSGVCDHVKIYEIIRSELYAVGLHFLYGDLETSQQVKIIRQYSLPYEDANYEKQTLVVRAKNPNEYVCMWEMTFPFDDRKSLCAILRNVVLDDLCLMRIEELERAEDALYYYRLEKPPSHFQQPELRIFRGSGSIVSNVRYNYRKTPPDVISVVWEREFKKLPMPSIFIGAVRVLHDLIPQVIEKYRI